MRVALQWSESTISLRIITYDEQVFILQAYRPITGWKWEDVDPVEPVVVKEMERMRSMLLRVSDSLYVVRESILVKSSS